MKFIDIYKKNTETGTGCLTTVTLEQVAKYNNVAIEEFIKVEDWLNSIVPSNHTLDIRGNVTYQITDVHELLGQIPLSGITPSFVRGETYIIAMGTRKDCGFEEDCLGIII